MLVAARVSDKALYGAGVHRRIFGHYFPSLTDTLPPFPVCAGFPRLGVLRRLRPTRAFGRRRTYPHPNLLDESGVGMDTDGSHVHCCPVNG